MKHKIENRNYVLSKKINNQMLFMFFFSVIGITAFLIMGLIVSGGISISIMCLIVLIVIMYIFYDSSLVNAYINIDYSKIELITLRKKNYKTIFWSQLYEIRVCNLSEREGPKPYILLSDKLITNYNGEFTDRVSKDKHVICLLRCERTLHLLRENYPSGKHIKGCEILFENT